MQTIGVHTAAQGRCVAKTGTLNYVTNLAGYCRSRGRHTLAFALFIDGPGNWPAIALLDQDGRRDRSLLSEKRCAPTARRRQSRRGG